MRMLLESARPSLAPHRGGPLATKAALLACTAATVLAGAFLTAATWSPAGADDLVTHHEFQVNCSPSHHQPDDPIVFPGLPGASHDHTFIGNMLFFVVCSLLLLLFVG